MSSNTRSTFFANGLDSWPKWTHISVILLIDIDEKNESKIKNHSFIREIVASGRGCWG